MIAALILKHSPSIVIYPANYYKKEKEFDDAICDMDISDEELNKLSSESMEIDFIELRFL